MSQTPADKVRQLLACAEVQNSQFVTIRRDLLQLLLEAAEEGAFAASVVIAMSKKQ